MNETDPKIQQLIDEVFPETERIKVRLLRDDIEKLQRMGKNRGVNWETFVGLAVREYVDVLERAGLL